MNNMNNKLTIILNGVLLRMRSFFGWSFFAVSLALPSLAPAQVLEMSGYVALESRLFPTSPLLDEQFSGGNFSLSLQPEFYYEWPSGHQSILLVPYFRLDQNDGNRTHFDIRELYWQKVWDSWELSVGLRRLFWGVTESQHLVDIINQTDPLDNLDAEDKLGQPMAHLTLIRNWGTVDFIVMPYFRERSFLNKSARLRFPVVIDSDEAMYESGTKEKHIDWAVRWFHTLGILDIGLSHFSGTGREPVLLPAGDSANQALAPFYPTIDQTGLDVQATTAAGWLLKLEAINRFGQGDRFIAAVGGFEYTFSNIKMSGIDVGVILEYHYDERGKDGTSFFDDDVFVGSRLAFNDVQSTDLLAGVVFDRDTGASFLNVEASRRLGDRYTLSVEIRSFVGASEGDLLFGLRKDHYFQLELSRYF